MKVEKEEHKKAEVGKDKDATAGKDTAGKEAAKETKEVKDADTLTFEGDYYF